MPDRKCSAFLGDTLTPASSKSRLIGLVLKRLLCAGEKGSDASAREATRKLVTARRQLAVLAPLLARLGLPAPPDPTLTLTLAGGRRGADEQPRNTIVRDMLRQLHAAAPGPACGKP